MHVSVSSPDTGKADVECGLIYMYCMHVTDVLYLHVHMYYQLPSSGQLEETLDSFLAPSEDTVKKTYEARIKNLARHFFQLLLRYGGTLVFGMVICL